MDTLLFRRATGVDSEKIAALHTESWRDAYRGIMPDWYLDGPIARERVSLWQSRFSSLPCDRYYVLVADSGAKLVGFVCVLLDEDPKWGACLDNLHVLPGLRNKGIGRKLFIKATQWMITAAPGLPIHLWVFKANDAARRFYDSLGGKIVDHQSKKILKGIEIPSVLYLWGDLEKLLTKLRAQQFS